MDDLIKGLPFAKGHGTGNDFVIVPDPDGELDLAPDVVAALCDRRRGLGGDGLLRVVRTASDPSAAQLAVGDTTDPGAAGPEWFMDYRNADGSLAEMCGNGVRVFARYLVEAGLATGPRVELLTRSGPVVALMHGEVIEVEMPRPTVYGRGTVRLAGVDYEGTVATCGNPNLVCYVDDPDALDLSARLRLDPGLFPAGANVEFVAVRDGLDARMRVVERGVGETLSCGSGACAAAAVVLADAGRDAGQVTMDVRGGRLTVALGPDRATLSGPAVIVATGVVRTGLTVSSGW
jgi:diaminopimelate epimerase